MKRFLSLLLAGLMVLSLSACGKEAPAPAPEPEVSVSEPATEEVPASVEETEEPEAEEEMPEPPVLSLKDIYAEHNMKVGTCLSRTMIEKEQYSEIVLSQFNSFTMENAMKPEATLKQQASKDNGEVTVEFNADAIKMLDFAKENNFAVRGHTLVWYSQTPDWFFRENFDNSGELVSREVMLERMESYIKQIFEQLSTLGYADMFYAFDVVNEAWMENGSLRQCRWTETIGDDYIWWAFYYADKYAPEHINLFYNDYNEQYKHVSLPKYVSELVDEDGRSLIDGIGLQAHLYTQDSLSTYFTSIERLASTGLILEITELDVCLGAYQKALPATEENLRAQGKYYYNLISGLMERNEKGLINMDSITFWGFNDSLSWRSNQSPLLYNSQCEPKYSYYGAALAKEFAGF